MLILVGPFTNNAVLLQVKEIVPGGEKIALRQRLDWGDNTFDAYLEKNTKYQLVVVVQGTREGKKVVADIQTGAGYNQSFTVTLHGDEVSVK